MQQPESPRPGNSDESAQPASFPVEIDVIQTKEMLDSGVSMLLIDCRGQSEIDTCRIEGSVHIPMREIADRISEVESHSSDRIVVHCHHGGRSLKVVTWMRENGFASAQNMSGGIDQWSQQIDPEVPRY